MSRSTLPIVATACLVLLSLALGSDQCEGRGQSTGTTCEESERSAALRRSCETAPILPYDPERHGGLGELVERIRRKLEARDYAGLVDMAISPPKDRGKVATRLRHAWDGITIVDMQPAGIDVLAGESEFLLYLYVHVKTIRDGAPCVEDVAYFQMEFQRGHWVLGPWNDDEPGVMRLRTNP